MAHGICTVCGKRTERAEAKKCGICHWKRRMRSDVRAEHFIFSKSTARYRAHYRRPDGTSVSIFRGRWVWEEENGVVPDGCRVIHSDGDYQNDSLDNLEVVTVREQLSYQAADLRKRRQCEHCRLYKSIDLRGRFCSVGCYSAHCLTMMECGHCGVEFKKDNAKRKFCSSKCSAAHQYRGSRLTASCRHCTREITFLRSSPRTFCSVKCSGARRAYEGKKQRDIKAAAKEHARAEKNRHKEKCRLAEKRMRAQGK